ncbi:hypothetical protein R3P38DRAFT_3459917 [Favolaschia claudopus]|uniref:Uncharacterized protein n=1 Tax=Favolaschia claudopus TaxID=2862362 RepID=A0AAV9ZHY8_9AGAR
MKAPHTDSRTVAPTSERRPNPHASSRPLSPLNIGLKPKPESDEMVPTLRWSLKTTVPFLRPGLIPASPLTSAFLAKERKSTSFPPLRLPSSCLYNRSSGTVEGHLGLHVVRVRTRPGSPWIVRVCRAHPASPQPCPGLGFCHREMGRLFRVCRCFIGSLGMVTGRTVHGVVRSSQELDLGYEFDGEEMNRSGPRSPLSYRGFFSLLLFKPDSGKALSVSSLQHC